MERLHEHLTVPAFEHHGKLWYVRIAGKSRRSEQRERRIATHLRPPADRKAQCGGQADAHAGEAAGADIDENARRTALAGQRRDHRHQPLGMAAAHHFMGRGDHGRSVEQRDRAGCGRGLDDESQVRRDD